LGSGLGDKGVKNKDLTNKAKAMFDDLDFDDEFDNTNGKKNDLAADLDFQEGSDSGDGNFDANALMNFTDYSNKRKGTDSGFNKPTGLSIKDVFDNKKKDDFNAGNDEDDWGMSNDDWGPSAPTEIKMNKDEAKSKNLNLLNNEELAAYKKGMDQDFNKNQLKPGDAGFTYDKVVDFSKNNNDEPLEDDSWGEDDGVEE